MNSKLVRSSVCLLAGAIAFLAAAQGNASERHFVFTHESFVLAPGHSEIEPWTTFRGGRSHYYARLDQRIEYEFGVLPGLQAALYWNYSTRTGDTRDAAGGPLLRKTSTEPMSASAELKYKLSDPVADALGSALYLETTVGPSLAALEGKLIFDKRIGRGLLAGNLVSEYARDWSTRGGAKSELELKVALAGGYFVTDSAMVGLEVTEVTELEDAKEVETSAFFAGPTVAWARDSFWLASTALVQAGALAGAKNGAVFDLEHQERFQWRLILGFHL